MKKIIILLSISYRFVFNEYDENILFVNKKLFEPFDLIVALNHSIDKKIENINDAFHIFKNEFPFGFNYE